MMKDGFDKDKIYKIIQWGLGLFAIFGVVLFSALWLTTLAERDTIERAGQTFIKYQISKEMRETRQQVSEFGYDEQLKVLQERYGDEYARVQKYLEDSLDEKIADAVAKLCRLDCESRSQVQNIIQRGLENRLSRAGISLETVASLIQNKYMTILEGLKRDIRIFSGTNIGLFLLLGLLVFVKKRATFQLLVPALILCVSTLLCAYFYVFGQNWFFTLIYNQFWGYAYTAYAGLILVCLLDVFLNRARITSQIVNMISQALGMSLSVVPC